MATKVGNLQVDLDAKVSKFTAKMNGAVSKLEGFSDAASKMVAPLAAVSASLTAIGAASLMTAAKFERGMTRVGALTESLGTKQFKKLEASALDMAAKTEFTARQVADAMGFMAQAGFSSTKVMAALPDTLQLASAGMLDVAQAADIVTNIMSGFGIQAAELSRVNDVLVSSFTGANVDLQGLGQAFKFVGPVAKGAGLAFEEIAASVALLGNAGIQGSMAGTSLRMAIAQLIKPTAEVTNTLNSLGVSSKDSSGKLRSLTDILADLEEAGATTEDVLKIFGIRAGPAMAALLEQGSDALKSFQDRLGRRGVAKAIADAQLDTFTGQVNILKSQIERLAIEIGKVLLPFSRQLISVFQGVFEKFIALPQPIKDMVVGLGALVAAATGIGSVLALVVAKLAFFKGIVAAVAAVMKTAVGVAFIKVVAALGVFIVAFKATQAVIGDTTPLLKTLSDAWRDLRLGGIEAFRTVMNWGMAFLDVITKIPRAIIAAILEFAGFKDAADTVRNFFDKANTFMSDFTSDIKGNFNKITKGFFEPFFDKLKKLNKAIKGFVDKAKEALGLNRVGEAQVFRRLPQQPEGKKDKKDKDKKDRRKKLTDEAIQKDFEKAIAKSLAAGMSTGADEGFKALQNKLLKLRAEFDVDMRVINAENERTGGPPIDEFRTLLALDARRQQFDREMIGASAAAKRFGEKAQVAGSSVFALDDASKASAKAMHEFKESMKEPTKNLAETFSDLARNGLNEFGKFIGARIPKEIREKFGEAGAKVGEALSQGGDVMGAMMKGALAAGSTALAAAGVPPGTLEAVAGVVIQIFQGAADGAKKIIDRGVGVAMGAVEGALGVIGDDRFKGAVDATKKTFQDVAAIGKDVFSGLMEMGPALLLLGSMALSTALGLAPLVILSAPLIAMWAALAAVVALVLFAFKAVVATIVSTAMAWAAAMAQVALIPIVVAGVVSALGFLATKTESFAALQEGFSQTMDRVVAALEPFFRELTSLVGLFDMVADVLLPLVNAFAGLASDFKGEIFSAVKGLAVAFLSLLVSVLKMNNKLILMGQILLAVVGAFAKGLSDFLAGFGVETEGIDGFVADLATASETLAKFRVSTSQMDKALDNLRNATLAEAEARAAEMEAARERAKEKAKQAAREATGLDDVSDAAKGLSESLTNVPDIIKVAEARFRAADPLVDMTSGLSPFDQTTTILDRLQSIMGGFVDSLSDILGGGPTGPGGFAFEGIRTAQDLTPGIFIEQLHASDPDDMFDKIEEVARRRGFESIDDPTGFGARAARRRR